MTVDKRDYIKIPNWIITIALPGLVSGIIAYGSQVSFTTLSAGIFKYSVDTYYCGTCSFADSRNINSNNELSTGWYYYLPDISAIIYVKTYLGTGNTPAYNISLSSKASTCSGVSCTP